MKVMLVVSCVLLGLASRACAEQMFDEADVMETADARFINGLFNSSSSATGLTLLGALILLGVIGYLVYAGGLLGNTAFNRNDYEYAQQYGQQPYDQYNQYAQYRSADGNYQGMNVLAWISMLKEMYENFDINDMECVQRQICEVTNEPRNFGKVAEKFTDGLKYAKVLDYVSLPDDMRELLDEYMEANREEQCESFKCPYSIKESMSRSQLIDNSL